MTMRLGIALRTDLALRVIRWLAAHPGHSQTASALAEATGASRSYLPQVMTSLVRAGWVASASGPHGGYRLVVDPRTLSLLALIEAVEGPVQVGPCAVTGSACPPSRVCEVSEAWTRATNALLLELARIPVWRGPDPSRLRHAGAAPTTPLIEEDPQ